ncbi:MAG: bifunctional oligoribonuclease/PAP phosphatase NrnA [Oscillospiraceae bacterium]|nr:bifunctional oligoribonuclease/PAP phosphatase NrnA [Oscillospiraceae bacterium]
MMSKTGIDIKQTAEFLSENDRFTLICHASPDGDTLGGTFALCGALQKLGKNARIITPEIPSVRFDYLKNAVSEQDLGVSQNSAREIVITVDVADTTLLGNCEKEYGGRIDLCIDHHVSNTDFAELTLLDSNAAAACEIVFELIKQLEGIHGKTIMNPAIAACLYTGIATDTGCFRFSNTTLNSHRLTAELMAHDFDYAGINYLLFEMRTKERLKLEKQALENVEFAFGGKCAMITLSIEMLKDADQEDLNGISSISRQIEGVELGVTLKEKEPNIWKVSLRSNDYVDARLICSNLGGGGHKRAAGCRVTGSERECKDKLLREIGLHIKQTQDL